MRGFLLPCLGAPDADAAIAERRDPGGLETQEGRHFLIEGRRSREIVPLF